MTERRFIPPARVDDAEELALHDSAMVVERDDRRRWRLAGPKVVDVLNGLLTNDIGKLGPGEGCYAAALTPKGKVIADLRVFARGGDFLVDTSGPAGTGWAEVLRKYVNPRLAKYEEVTDATTDIAVAGPRAAELLATALGTDHDLLENLQAHSHATVALAGPVHLVVRTPEIGVPAYDVIVSADERGRVFGLLTEAGCLPGSAITWDIARIANGWPAWGTDMDENTLAQEANLDAQNAISYDKGCYTGQETVARVHFRGHVNRYLQKARFSAGDEIPAGAQLLDDSGKVIGDLRSSAISAREGGVAIAMVRREVAAPATVRAFWDDANAAVHVMADSA